MANEQLNGFDFGADPGDEAKYIDHAANVRERLDRFVRGTENIERNLDNGVLTLKRHDWLAATERISNAALEARTAALEGARVEIDRLREENSILTKAIERERAKVRVLVIGQEIQKLLEERDDLADEYGLPTPWLHS